MTRQQPTVTFLLRKCCTLKQVTIFVSCNFSTRYWSSIDILKVPNVFSEGRSEEVDRGELAIILLKIKSLDRSYEINHPQCLHIFIKAPLYVLFAITVLHYLQDRFTGNDAACNPVLLSVVLYDISLSVYCSLSHSYFRAGRSDCKCKPNISLCHCIKNTELMKGQRQYTAHLQILSIRNNIKTSNNDCNCTLLLAIVLIFVWRTIHAAHSMKFDQSGNYIDQLLHFNNMSFFCCTTNRYIYRYTSYYCCMYDKGAADC